MENNLDKTQGTLYVGYILLIFLGIINETLFYSQIGINILEYSDILDVLISPISKLSSSIALLMVSLFVILVVIWLPKKSEALSKKKWFAKFFKLDLSKAEVERQVFNRSVLFALCFFVGVFVGAGSGKGQKLKQKIESGEIEYSDQIAFMDGQSIDVEVVGKNSSYVFYLIEQDSTVQISPISGTIKYMSIRK